MKRSRNLCSLILSATIMGCSHHSNISSEIKCVLVSPDHTETSDDISDSFRYSSLLFLNQWDNWAPVCSNGIPCLEQKVFDMGCLQCVELIPINANKTINAKVTIDTLLLESEETKAGYFDVFGDDYSQQKMRTQTWDLRRIFRRSAYINVFDASPSLYQRESSQITKNFLLNKPVNPWDYLNPIDSARSRDTLTNSVRIEFSESGWTFKWDSFSETFDDIAEDRFNPHSILSAFVVIDPDSFYIYKPAVFPSNIWIKLTRQAKAKTSK